ncbi:MAG: PAS domain S-box protein, partial [Pseudomonadota bacterium]
MPKSNIRDSVTRILICADETASAESLAQGLQNLGYEVIGTVSGLDEAIGTARESKPDLVLIDVNPGAGSDGIDPAGHILAALDIPVVYLTGAGTRDVPKGGDSEEPYLWLTKPISGPGLRCAVQTALYKRRADKQVRDSQERLHAVMQAIGDGVWDWDIASGETFYSPNYFSMLGLDPDKCGEGFPADLELIHPEDRDRTRKALDDCVRGKVEGCEIQFRTAHKEGSWRWMLGRGKSINRDSEGRSTRMVGTLTDITERKTGEEEVKSAMERFRLISENARDVIWCLDKEYRFTYVSPADERMRGFKAEELIGRTIFSVIKPSCVETLRTVALGRQEDEKRGIKTGLIKHEFEVICKDGGHVWTEGYVTPTRDEHGEISGFVGITRDVSQRKKAENALKESEERFSKAFRHAPVLITISSVNDGTYIEVNDRFVEVSGYSREAAIGKTSVELGWVSAEDRQRLFNELSTFGRVRGMELKLNHAEGREVRCIYNAELIQVDGQPMLLSIANDVTDLKRTELELRRTLETLEEKVQERTDDLCRLNEHLALEIAERRATEQALRESEELYRVLVETTNTGYVAVGDRGVVLAANREYARLTGHEQIDLILGRSVVEWTAEHDRDRNAAEVEKCFREGFVRNLEIDYVHPDGRLVPIEINATVVPGPAGSRIMTLCREISERKMGQQALLESEERFRRLFEQSPIGISVFSLDRRIFRVNQSYCRIVGYSQEELLKMNIDDVSLPDELEREHDLIDMLVSNEIPSFTLEKRIVRKSGEIAWVRLTATTIRDREGHNLHGLGMVEDITASKKLERELKASLSEASRLRVAAESANTAKSEFLATMSHELRTPLNAVIGFSELLEARLFGDLNQKQMDGVREIRSAGHHLLDLISDILDLSKVESGRSELEPTDVDVGEL